MNEIRLVDLVIARIPNLKARQRAVLCKNFTTDNEIEALCVLSPSEIKLFCAKELSKNNDKQGELFTESQAAQRQKKLSAMAKDSFSMEDVRHQAEKDAVFMEKLGINCVSITCTDYPPLLKEIFDPPAVIFYRGNLDAVKNNTVAIVGTRKAQAQSLNFCYKITKALGDAGVTVVSGLALGIDAMAHRGNIEGGAPTVAVLGSSVDQIYPSSNRNLARRILEGCGAILSEYPPQTHPAKWRFPERNRIISGLCPFTLVIEAGEKSGALITADFALEQNRELAVASVGDHVFGIGCERLAADGAKKITCVNDIFEETGFAPPSTEHKDITSKKNLACQLADDLGIL
ncbi:MAG: hypothetical protein Ta2F_01420 [Termitinemataceae bacterium]|nr:MAG: hypothetical protein Ta2F_01420 [Termitinemataceae bacterium]